MIERMELKGVHLTIDENLRKYVERKLGRLDRLMSKRSRESSHLEVTLKETKAKAGKQCHCDVTLHLPHENIVVKESTVNMFAAVDIAETKLKLQLKKYKDANDRGKLRHRFSRASKRPVPELIVTPQE